MSKKWIICSQCKFALECTIGQVRNTNIEIEPEISCDNGCYNYDQYYNLFYSSQLKLFSFSKQRVTGQVLNKI